MWLKFACSSYKQDGWPPWRVEPRSKHSRHLYRMAFLILSLSVSPEVSDARNPLGIPQKDSHRFYATKRKEQRHYCPASCFLLKCWNFTPAAGSGLQWKWHARFLPPPQLHKLWSHNPWRSLLQKNPFKWQALACMSVGFTQKTSQWSLPYVI